MATAWQYSPVTEFPCMCDILGLWPECWHDSAMYEIIPLPSEEPYMVANKVLSGLC